MARGSQELEQQFISTAREKTGRDLPEWMTIIRDAGVDEKPNTILKWLKEKHGLNHLQANFLSGIYLNDGKPVYDYAVLLQKLFDGKDHLKPIYDQLEQRVTSNLNDVVFVPTRTYVSIEGSKIFACATMTKSCIRVGLDLGELTFDNYAQKAKSLGAMPNLTHMIEVDAQNEVNDRLMGFVQQAYQRTHHK